MTAIISAKIENDGRRPFLIMYVYVYTYTHCIKMQDTFKKYLLTFFRNALYAVPRILPL